MSFTRAGKIYLPIGHTGKGRWRALSADTIVFIAAIDANE